MIEEMIRRKYTPKLWDATATTEMVAGKASYYMMYNMLE